MLVNLDETALIGLGIVNPGEIAQILTVIQEATLYFTSLPLQEEQKEEGTSALWIPLLAVSLLGLCCSAVWAAALCLGMQRSGKRHWESLYRQREEHDRIMDSINQDMEDMGQDEADKNEDLMLPGAAHYSPPPNLQQGWVYSLSPSPSVSAEYAFIPLHVG